MTHLRFQNLGKWTCWHQSGRGWSTLVAVLCSVFGNKPVLIHPGSRPGSEQSWSCGQTQPQDQVLDHRGSRPFWIEQRLKEKQQEVPGDLCFAFYFRTCWFREENHKVFFRGELQNEEALVFRKNFSLCVHVPLSPCAQSTINGKVKSLSVTAGVTGNSLALDDPVVLNRFFFSIF